MGTPRVRFRRALRRRVRGLFRDLGGRGTTPEMRRLRVRAVPKRHAMTQCRPLTDPPFQAGTDAGFMRNDDVVLGFRSGGESRAYPWWIMDNHHVANDVVGGQMVLIVLCEMCSSAIAFDPVVDGGRLTFEVTHIFNGTNAVQDHQTRSLWSPYLAQAIAGPLKGTRLGLLPLEQMEWGAWRGLHPETKVLPERLGSRTGHGSDHSIGSPHIKVRFRRTIQTWDKRLPHNTLVLGVLTPGQQRAYPLELLREAGGVVNDELGGAPIVVLLNRTEGSYAALAFSRTLEGKTLSFAPGPEGAVDQETGSSWTAEGEAVAGPLAGSKLPFVDSHVSEWFIWAAHYPAIEIARLPG